MLSPSDDLATLKARAAIHGQAFELAVRFIEREIVPGSPSAPADLAARLKELHKRFFKVLWEQQEAVIKAYAPIASRTKGGWPITED